VKYRPWGPIDWALSVGTAQQWRFIGALGTEERSLCSWSYFRGKELLTSELLVQVADVESVKYAQRIRDALNQRRAEFGSRGGAAGSIRELPLMAELFRIQEFAKLADDGSASIIFDITSLPKRFFFVVLRRLALSTSVKNLVVTYTSPAAYAEDGPLYENTQSWQTLPGFAGTSDDPEMWVVSIGFLVESLSSHLGANFTRPVKLLMPFPSPLGSLRRMWKSVESLQQNHPAQPFAEHRVDGLDMSAAFDRIGVLCRDARDRVAFAPFGPKPISAAMCLHSLYSHAAIHYAQPTIYHPDYSTGVLDGDAARAVVGYWIKHDGEMLYTA
jgi:hypothetical protein